MQKKSASNKQICYYEVLGIEKKATPQEIKQSYKKLALKYHPDKNTDKQFAKLKFHELSQAYTVLNDANKRQKYDKYGVRQSQLNDLKQYQDMMGGDFEMFQSFIDEMLSFDQMQSMLQQMFKFNGGKKGKKKGGRTKKGGRGGMGGLGDMMDMFNFSEMDGLLEDTIADTLFGGMGFGQMSESQLNELMKDPEFRAMMTAQGLSKQQIIQIMCPKGPKDSKGTKSLSKGTDQWQQGSSDDQQLTQQQLLYIQFGNCHISKKKNKKKKVISCKFDQTRIKQDQILMHFMQHHKKQYTQWLSNNKKPFEFKDQPQQGKE